MLLRFIDSLGKRKVVRGLIMLIEYVLVLASGKLVLKYYKMR